MSIKRGYELKRLLTEYNDAYYNQNNPVVSDPEYDRFYDEYAALEKQYPELKGDDSPTLLVGSNPSGKVNEITHTTPLLSIENKGKTSTELKKWYDDIGGEGTKVIIEPKFDGVTINTRYEGGKFMDAAKRGNGYTGDEVSSAVGTIGSVQKTISIKGKLEVRGEGILYCTPFFEKYSKEVGGDYSNPRNLSAGSFGLLDPKEVSKRELDIIFFDTGVCPVDFNDDEDRLEWLSENGFKTAPYIVCSTFKELESICFSYFNGMIINKNGFNVLETNGNVSDILCDGLVLKVADLSKREKLGITSRGPRWAFAFKFKSIKVVSPLNDVTIQIGRTGKLTPVGHIEASIGGTSISRVTLNNRDYIKTVGAAPDEIDKIALIREGEVIDFEMKGGACYLISNSGDLKVDNKESIRLFSNEFAIFAGDVMTSITNVKTIKNNHESYIVITAGGQDYYQRPNMMLEAMAMNCPVIEVADDYFELKIGDKVVIERANDVIPRLIGIRYDLRDGNERNIDWPQKCPTCGTIVEELYPLHYCNNINCHNRLVGSLKHFVKRDAMNIDGLGDAMAELFIKNKFIDSLTDLYTIDNFENELLNIDGFGKTKLENLYKAVEESKNREFHQFIYALGINEVGRTTSKALSMHFKNIDALMMATEEELMEIQDLGVVAAHSIVSFFKSNTPLIEEFRLLGINMVDSTKTTGDALLGKTFVITGTLKESRSYYENLIEKNGGKTSGSVSKKTNYVVIGSEAGSKENKALELVKKGEPLNLVYGHDAFMALLEG